jgi:hypothetical protein
VRDEERKDTKVAASPSTNGIRTRMKGTGHLFRRKSLICQFRNFNSSAADPVLLRTRPKRLIQTLVNALDLQGCHVCHLPGE